MKHWYRKIGLGMIIFVMSTGWVHANDEQDILLKSRFENVIKELRYLKTYCEQTKQIAGSGSGRMVIDYEQLSIDLEAIIQGVGEMVKFNPKEPKKQLKHIEQLDGDYSI